jgi:aminoglycoside 6'-N-acetyltransferase
MRRWLLEPHVRRWWDDGVLSPYPDAELEHYRDAIKGLDRTYRYVAWLDDRPVGMFQHYLIDDHPEYARTLALGERAVGVDLFIGEPDLIGRGHGPAMLRQFLRDVALPFHRTEICVIGPAASNASAIRAYEKAGFKRLREVRVPDEPEPELLLRITRADLDAPSNDR